MIHDAYEPVIGLEVHCQLDTAAKAFSPDAAAYGAEPNTHVDPVSLGHPGTLPVLSDTVLEYALRLGVATECTIAPRTVFARKHYFYPDLPKGYQLTQQGAPLCYDGFIELPAAADAGGDGQPRRAMKRVGITRIQIEEDAGRSVHDRADGTTRVDYNRCGVPLVEVVSAPDLRSPREAYQLLRAIRQLVRYLGICDGRMEEGSLRCDANVSVRPRGRAEAGTRTEIKNLNSLRAVERALDYEVARQIACLERGEAVAAETRAWDADAQATRPLRRKEEAADYRYLPDPDLVPVTVDEALLRTVRRGLPEMPDARRQRFVDDLSLPARDAARLTEERATADYFENAVSALFKRTKGGNTQAQAKAIANVILTDVRRVLNEDAEAAMETFPIEPDRLAGLVYLRLEDELSSSAAQDVFDAMLESDKPPKALADERNLRQVGDEEVLGPLIDKVLKRHSKNVKRYLSGKKGLIGFFVGQVRSRFDGSPDPQVVRRLLEKKLKQKRS